LVSSCAGPEVDDDDPQSLFDAAERDVSNDKYLFALDKFRKVKNKFPYSKLSVLSQLRIADLYYLQESFPEAASSYELFLELHPKHEKASYALYRVGESHLAATPTIIDRDLSSAHKALDAFNSFLRKHPSEDLSNKAREKVVEIRNKLAEKELMIGNFYKREEKFLAAQKRYEKIIELYPETVSAKNAREKIPDVSKK